MTRLPRWLATILNRLRLRCHKWRMTARAYRMQMRKKHGAERPLRRHAWFVARCAGWIAAGQELGQRSPYYGRLMQPRAMTAPVERRGPGTFEPSALDPSEVREHPGYDREGRPREVVEAFRRNEGG